MNYFKKLVTNNLLLFGIGLGMFLAWVYPVPGVWLASMGTTNLLVVIIFFCQGALIDRGAFPGARRLLKTFGWGFIVCQVLGPVLGWAAVRMFDWPPDHQIGFVLTCCMAPTLVSGVVLAARAGGAEASALLLAAGLNLLGTLVIPLNLGWTLGAIVRLDTLSLFLKLFCLVVLPVAAGQLFRRRTRNVFEKARGILRQTPVAAFSMVIFIAFSMQAGRWKTLAIHDLAVLIPSSIVVHVLLLIIGYFGGRRLFRLDEADCRSVAIVCSQKTIPLAIVVWSNVFAQKYPLAMLAPLVYHFSQTLIDGVVVSVWNKAGGAERNSSAS